MAESMNWAGLKALLRHKIQSSLGWEEERASQMADMVSEEIRKHYGGREYYLPKRTGQEKRRCVEEFTGRNITQLAEKYGLSKRTVSRYIKEHWEEKKDKVG